MPPYWRRRPTRRREWPLPRSRARGAWPAPCSERPEPGCPRAPPGRCERCRVTPLPSQRIVHGRRRVGRRHGRARRRTRSGTMPDRSAAVRGKAASGRFGRHAARACEANQLGETPRLGAGHRGRERRQAIVPPPLVVERARRTPVRFDDEPLLEHAMDGPVQGAGAKFELTIGARFDVLDDGIAMPVAIGEGEEDMKRDRGERQQGVDVSGREAHTTTIAAMNIASMAIILIAGVGSTGALWQYCHSVERADGPAWQWQYCHNAPQDPTPAITIWVT